MDKELNLKDKNLIDEKINKKKLMQQYGYYAT